MCALDGRGGGVQIEAPVRAWSAHDDIESRTTSESEEGSVDRGFLTPFDPNYHLPCPIIPRPFFPHVERLCGRRIFLDYLSFFQLFVAMASICVFVMLLVNAIFKSEYFGGEK